MKIKEVLLRLLFPPKCISCGKILNINKIYPFICKCCEKDIKNIKVRVCPTCSKPLDILDNMPYCAYCADNKYNFNYLVTPFVYDGSIKNAIIHMKFHSRPHIGKSLAVSLYNRIKKHKDFQADAITFAPISPNRFKSRKYNQSEIIANHLGNMLNIPVVNLLEKIKETKKQSTLTEKERLENLKGSIIYNKKSEYKNILFVDDVYTTGATTKICCQELHKAGVKNIVVGVASVTQKDTNQEG